MNCETANRMMQDYLDGSLPTRRERLLENHLAECAGCKDELSMHLALIRLIQEEPLQDPPPDLLPTISAKLPAIHPAARNVHTFRLASLVAFAAGFLAVAALSWSVASSDWGHRAANWAFARGVGGIPLVVVLSAAMLVGYVVGQLGITLAVGRRLSERLAPSLTSQAFLISIGIVLLAAVCTVPVIGGMLCSVLALLGFGAAATMGFHASPIWLWKHWRRRDRWGEICTLPRKSSGFSSTPPPSPPEAGPSE